ncbi:MAG TPA: hypothetical protein VK638_52990 [Edaphobacter sp.]|nr:hypothetical protein [Edaphobacter sp.]
MVEKLTEALNPERPWRLTYAGKCYSFATEQQATIALLLYAQADQVVTFRDGTSPAATARAI